MTCIQHSFDSDWLFNTQSRVLQADWLMLKNNEKAALNTNMPYLTTFLQSDFIPEKFQYTSQIILSFRSDYAGLSRWRSTNPYMTAKIKIVTK